jgi:hypothetical protein
VEYEFITKKIVFIEANQLYNLNINKNNEYFSLADFFFRFFAGIILFLLYFILFFRFVQSSFSSFSPLCRYDSERQNRLKIAQFYLFGLVTGHFSSRGRMYEMS